MNDPRPAAEPESNPMHAVREGMAVYDSAGAKVGKVKQIFFGSEPASDEMGTGPATAAGAQAVPPGAVSPPLSGAVAGAFGDEESVPGVLRGRLEREGYIRIDTGLLRSDRFAVPSMIASAGGDRVDLNVPVDQLFKRE